jgi:hypothetical protein
MRFIPLLLLFALAGCRFEESRPAPVADPDAWGRVDADPAQATPDPAAVAPGPATTPGRA